MLPKPQFRSWLLTASLLLAGLCSLTAQQAVEFKQQWLVNKRYHQKVVMDQQMNMQMNGQAMAQKTTTTMEVTSTVKPHENGRSKRLIMKYGRVIMDMDGMGMKTKFDSAQGGAAQDPLGLGKIFGALTGKEFRLVLDSENKVQDVENMAEITAAFADANPMAKQMMQQMISKEYFAQMLEQSALKSPPGQPVKVGGSWPFQSDMKLPQLGSVGIQGSYTFKGMGRRQGVACAELEQKAKLNLDLSALGAGNDPSAKAMQQMGMKVEDGAINGTVWFDPALGMARESQMVQTMKMHMNNPQAPDAKIQMDLVQNISQVLEKVEDVK